MNATAPRPRTLQERCTGVELLVLDVDGVLTDGGVRLDADGREVKQFFVRDGVALRSWSDAGKRSAIISGRSSPAVEARGRELGVWRVVQGAADKLWALQSVLADAGLEPRAICYVGDDLPDLPALRLCGLAVAVADADPQVRLEAHHVTRAGGGRGAVREVVELILGCQGLWGRLIEGGPGAA
jgi:3-deoxy-D-manno-octulosonate 8-phosphate phosphatase (KDO 8-P phosphatase)